MWRMHKNTTGVSLTVFFIYSAPSAETLCSTYMAGSPSGTIIARSSPGKSSLSSRCCSSTHRGSSESVSSLVLAPSTPPGTVHSPKIQHIRPCSDLSKLHRIQLKLINRNDLHWPRYFRYSSGWESKCNRYLEMVSVMDRWYFFWKNFWSSLTWRDLLAFWSLEHGWKSLAGRSSRRTALGDPSPLAPIQWNCYWSMLSLIAACIIYILYICYYYLKDLTQQNWSAA